MKKILILFILIILTGCGFKPIYSSNESDFSIIKIETEKNILNEKFSNKLKAFSNPKSNNRIFIRFDIEKKKLIKAKNKKNVPSIFELRIDLELTIIDDLNNEKSKNFTLNTTYNNNEDKFQLGRYEKKLEEALVTKLALNALEFLSN